MRDIPLALDGFEVMALNVTKPGSDNIDSRDDMKRLEDWKPRVEASGGQWRVINDLDRLDPAFFGVGQLSLDRNRPRPSRGAGGESRRSGNIIGWRNASSVWRGNSYIMRHAQQ